MMSAIVNLSRGVFLRYDEDVSFEMRSGNLTAYGDGEAVVAKYLVANNWIEVGVGGANRVNRGGWRR